MIVLDASAAVHYLLATEGVWDQVVSRLEDEDLHVPQVFEYEVASALRAGAIRRDMTAARAEGALNDLTALTVTRHPPQPLLERIWQLRNSLTVFDASYVALAEALEAPILTADGRMARSRGHGATFELVSS